MKFPNSEPFIRKFDKCRKERPVEGNFAVRNFRKLRVYLARFFSFPVFQGNALPIATVNYPAENENRNFWPGEAINIFRKQR